MKVIFIKTGEVKEAATGYAKNYLFPNKLAILATPEAIKKAEEKRKKIAAQASEMKKKDEETLNKLKDAVLKILVKTNEEGKLFAALNIKDIMAEIKKQKNIEIPEAWITMPTSPVKELGDYAITISSQGYQVKMQISLIK